MNNIFSIPIYLSPYVTKAPKIQIDPNFEWCSDEFRAAHNQWLADTFGYTEVAYMIDVSAMSFGVDGERRPLRHLPNLQLIMNQRVAKLLMEKTE